MGTVPFWDSETARARRAMAVMLEMNEFEIAALERAAAGD